MTTLVEHAVDVAVPTRTAYDQWTQFEDFPLFMRDVEEIEQIDETHLHWRTKVRGVTREWNAIVTEQIPDARVAWTAEDGPRNAGVVTFHPIDDDHCRVMLQLEFEPEGAAEQYADKVGVVKQAAERDLEDFRDFIEKRGRATGSWRGTIGHEASNDGSSTDGEAPNANPAL